MMQTQSYRFADCEILRPISDVAFKAIFSHSAALLQDLLSCALCFPSPMTSVTYINTELSPDLDGAKSCRLDVAVQLDDGTLVDIEIQASPDPAIKRRSVAYASKLLSSQIEAGKKSPQPDVIALFLLNYEIFKEAPKQWLHSFELRTPDGRYLQERVFRIDFVELLKGKQLHAEGNSVFSKWIIFFTAETFQELKALCDKDKVLRQAKEKLEMISKDKQIWSDARAKWEGEFAITQKFLAAEARGKAEGKAEGLREGIEKGMEKGIRSAALGMLEVGMPHEQICKALKITEAELAKLLSTAKEE